jgi:hypothetical protein
LRFTEDWLAERHAAAERVREQAQADGKVRTVLLDTDPEAAQEAVGARGTGDAAQASAKKRRRSSGPPAQREHVIQKDILTAMSRHVAVDWAVRMNTGSFEVGRDGDKGGKRRVRCAFVGCSDIIGQMRDGRFLACEVKRPGEKPTDDQQAFLDRVNKAGGVGFCAHSVTEALLALDSHIIKP